MKRTSFLRGALIAVAALALGACAQFGVSTPTDFPSRAAAAQISVTTVRSSALTLLNAGVITAKDARNAQTAADAGNDAIDLAKGFYATACPVPAAPAASAAAPPPTCVSTDANSKLTAAVAILTATQSYLASRGSK